MDPVRKALWLSALGLHGGCVCVLHFPCDHLNEFGNRLKDWAVPRIEPYGSDESGESSAPASQSLFSPPDGSSPTSQPLQTSTQTETNVFAGESAHIAEGLEEDVATSVQAAIEICSQLSSSSGLLSESVTTSDDTDDPDYDGRSADHQKFNADQEKENVLRPDGSRVFLVSEAQLRKLFRRCLSCGRLLENDAVIYGIGVDIRVESFCDQCSVQKWYSFTPSGESKLHEGNGRVTAATIVSGNTFEDINSISKNLNLQMMYSTTFHRFAAKYVYPAIDEAYIDQHTRLIEDIRSEQLKEDSLLKLGMDGRFSRPGFTATFGVVSALDIDSGKILDAHVLKRNDEEITSSPHMEVVGVKRLLDSFLRPCRDSDDGTGDPNDPSSSSQPAVQSCCIGAVATDDSTAIMKLMELQFPNIVHCGDPWHLLKSVRKRLEAAAQKASCRELGFWIKCIDNFLWTCMMNCGGDDELLLEQWRSVVHHVSDKHEWMDDDSFVKFHECLHPIGVPSKAQCIDPDSSACRALMAIVNDVKLQARIRRCRHFLQTSALESFHAVLLKYVPKRLHFGDRAFRARVKLAVIDWNTNVGRGNRVNADGAPMLRLTVPPSAKDWRVKTLTADKSYHWSALLAKRIWTRAEDGWKRGERPKVRPLIIERPLVAQFEAPDRAALLESFKRRKLGHVEERMC